MYVRMSGDDKSAKQRAPCRCCQYPSGRMINFMSATKVEAAAEADNKLKTCVATLALVSSLMGATRTGILGMCDCASLEKRVQESVR